MRNAILCAVFGDSYGLPYEFPTKTKILNNGSILPDYERRVGGRYFPTKVNVKGGSFSDDTQLLLATLRSLSYEKWYEFFKRFELPAFLSYEQGAGRATRASCQALEKRKLPWKYVSDYFNFGGNGVAIRSLPHIFADKPIEEIMFDIQLNGIFTHGSPVGLLGAKLYGYIAWCIYHNKNLKGMSYKKNIWGRLDGAVACNRNSANSLSLSSANEYDLDWSASLSDKYLEEWVNTQKSICAKLDYIESGLYNKSVADILKELNAIGTYKGSGINCTLASYALFLKYKGNTLKGITEVGSFIGADTDSLASLLGGLLGLVQGLDEGYYKLLDNYDYINKVIKSFQEVNTLIPYSYYSEYKYKSIKESFKDTGVGSKYISFPFGIMTVTDIVENETLTDTFKSMTYKVSTEIGQNLQIKYYKRVQ